MTNTEDAQDAEIFQRETAAFGGRFHRDLAPAPVKAVYEEVAERAKDLIAGARNAVQGLPPIHFDFIHNAAINAVAFRASDRYFIGINTGTLFMLRMVIGRMLSDPRVFTSIGDPSEEVGDLKPMKDYRPDADAILRTNQILTPRNAIRGAYAWFLQDQAIMFFIGHEIAHVSRGHVDYLLAKRGMPQASEFSKSATNGDKESRIERQALEQDADRRSIISRIDSLRVTQQKPRYTSPPWSPADNSPFPLIRDWTVSLSILFRLFGDVRFSGAELREASYPPLPIRRLYAEMVGKWMIETEWDAALKKTATNAMNQGRNKAEEAFATILGESVSMHGFVQAKSRAGINHGMRIEEYWNSTLVDKLRPYSYEEF